MPGINLLSCNIPKRNIFCGCQSGKDFDRSAYQKMLKRLKSGDLLIVQSIDRLGRNCKDIFIEWQRITKEIGADMISQNIAYFVCAVR